MEVKVKTLFTGLENLIGKTKLEKRHQAKVTIIGLGGIGSWAAECISRSGIGHITLIDLDDICVSNTNRQIHTMQSTLGQSKVLTLKNRLIDISPEIEVHTVQDFLTSDNMQELISKDHIILDAMDSLKVKCELISYCLEQHIPLITTGGAAGKTDPTKVQINDLSQTFNDPLLLRVRKKLRRGFDFPKKKKVHLGIRTVFSPEEMLTLTISPNNDMEEICDQDSIIPNCNNGLGTCVTVISTFGILAAKEVLNIIDSKN
jgi:tRNA A37 threonylcarbamoyladenosine dehydratase